MAEVCRSILGEILIANERRPEHADTAALMRGTVPLAVPPRSSHEYIPSLPLHPWQSHLLSEAVIATD